MYPPEDLILYLWFLIDLFSLAAYPAFFHYYDEAASTFLWLYADPRRALTPQCLNDPPYPAEFRMTALLFLRMVILTLAASSVVVMRPWGEEQSRTLRRLRILPPRHFASQFVSVYLVRSTYSLCRLDAARMFSFSSCFPRPRLLEMLTVLGAKIRLLWSGDWTFQLFLFVALALSRFWMEVYLIWSSLNGILWRRNPIFTVRAQRTGA